MGEACMDAFRRVKLEFHGSKLTSDDVLTTLREKLVKIGARLVKHWGYFIFQMAEVFVDRLLFGKILDRIDRLRCSGFT